MTITVNDLKNFLRIDYSDDDAVLSNLLDTAKSYALFKTGVEYSNGDLLYEQLLKFLVQHFYDNRSAIRDNNVTELPFTITDLIKSITYRGALT